MNIVLSLLAGIGAGSLLAGAWIGIVAIWDWAVYGRFEKRMEAEIARRAALAAREAAAANDPTPPTITFSAPGWHPSCGLIVQVWNEPHPAAAAEQILREAACK